MVEARGTSPPPPRNTRPGNRRTLITAAAADLFYRLGYDRVSMNDIAAAVGVGPSALYRHFAGKQQLLTGLVLEEFQPFAEICARPGADLDATAGALAGAALDHRQLGVLWQRESRHLPVQQRDVLRAELRQVAAGLTGMVRAFRPDLTGQDARFRGWCAFSVLTSPSYHRVELSRAAFEQLLRSCVRVVCEQPPLQLAGRGRAARRPTSLSGRASRRRLLLSAGARLFSDRGYTEVTTEDIGAAAGIAGPSLYHYFASKQELLGAVLTRGAAWLEVELERTLASEPEASAALRELLRSYTTFAFDQGGFIDALVSEVNHLPDDERHRIRQTQHAYVAEWVGLLCEARPELDQVRARILVQAALTAANDMARTGGSRHVEAVCAIGTAVMLDTAVQTESDC
ncbi:TetR family transcriptional regulator [Saccharopolyspora sp. HNM0983]|uniref:TetR family transcriptional regulator n=1 Tax=Saccharopolyspora montiporae TaxID=2781240 RepID=A0A929BB21_9PSEU|nr:TetR family transcriptional regulator [Saccharopolyspora sp. HNM0983]MBE9376577.1 TetR family transcriptional regulator [Saccharopolyspora sp. HNM0983]